MTMRRMSLMLRTLLVFGCLLASSDAASRLATSEDCYESGEPIEVAFQTDSPTLHDWIALVPSDASLIPFPSQQVRRWKFTCGSRSCPRVSLKGSGTLELGFANLRGSWKIILVTLGQGGWAAASESNPFSLRGSGQCVLTPPTTPQPVTSRPSRAPVAKPTRTPVGVPVPTTAMPTFTRPLPSQDKIETNKRKYAPNEDIVVTFEYSDPRDNDWVGIFPFLSANNNQVADDGAFWMWVCGGQAAEACSSVIQNGSLTFGAGGLEESWGESWPLSNGAYKAVLVRNGQAPYQVIADSARFTVETAPQPAPTTRAPVTRAPVTRAPVTRAPVTVAPTIVRPLPSTDFIKTDKLMYFRGEDIEISFSTKNAQDRDWVVIANADVAGEIRTGEVWLWACGERDPCSGVTEEGKILFGESHSQVRWNQGWPLRAGTYKAFLARVTGQPWPIFLESKEFTIIDLSEKIEAAADDIRTLIRGDKKLGPKFVRLGFHDCVGGCDGCVDLQYADNNGLLKPIEALDSVVSAHEDLQLGISRADIWALSALVGADEAQPGRVADFSLTTLGRRNCEDANSRCFDDGGQLVDCSRVRGPHRELPHPDITTKDLFLFFKNEFDFGVKETVALLGAHTLGALDRKNSGFNGPHGWVSNEEVLDNDYYFELVGNPNPDVPFVDQLDLAPPWFRAFENNTDLDGIPDRNLWEAFPQGQEGQRILMLNADVALVRELDDNNMDKHGRVSCAFIGEGRCPHATASLEFAAEYRINNNLWLRDFQDVFQRMLINEYTESTDCFNGVCLLSPK